MSKAERQKNDYKLIKFHLQKLSDQGSKSKQEDNIV